MPAWAETACGNLDKKTCFQNAVSLIKRSDGNKAFALQAFNKFDALCDMKNAQSCTIAADIARDTLKDTQLELNIYSKKCDEGFPQYCGAAVLMTRQVSAPHYDLTLARSFSVKGCVAKDAYLCYLQGRLHGPNKDYPEMVPNGSVAQEGYYKTCRFGKGVKNVSEDDHKFACSAANFMGGKDYQYNQNLDYRQYGLKQTCVMGDINVCDRAIYAFYYGRFNFDRRVEEAGLLAEHLCVQGNSKYCGQASNMWREDGQADRAILFSNLLCEKYPSGESCALTFHTTQDIYGDDAPETKKAAGLACNKGSGQACWYLAASDGNEYVRNGSNEVFENACRYGISEICEYIQRMKNNFAIEDRNVEIRRQNAANAQAREQTKARRQQESRRTSGPSWDQYMAAGNNYWSNWKPSYCSNYTRGGVTSKVECAN